MPERIVWKDADRSPGLELGYVGEICFFSVSRRRYKPEGFALDVILPGYGSTYLNPMESRESAKEYAEKVVLPEFLKKAGLMFKPAPKKRAPKKV